MILASALVLSALLAAPAASGVEVKVTQEHLRALCLDGAAVEDGRRAWRLAPGPHRLVATMANAPRPGAPDADAAAGAAAVSFTVETGHRYEVEVRAPATTYARRVWTKGDWKPVVRDRTPDHVVSGEAEWVGDGCR